MELSDQSESEISDNVSISASTESSVDSMIKEPTYIIGHHNSSSPSDVILCALMPTEKGWRCRSTHRKIMNHDYVSHETISMVMGWMDKDFKHNMYVTQDREEAVALLAYGESQHNPRMTCRLESFLHGNPMWDDMERGDKVLQHLEYGYTGAL